MKTLYDDITSRIIEPPLWWTMFSVPRYEPFHPRLASNWSAREVVLLKIECASCRERFLVEMCWRDTMSKDDMYPISYFVKEYHAAPNYGDPPRHDYKGNRCAGETMTCDDIKIMEFWRRDADREWERVSEYEIFLVD